MIGEGQKEEEDSPLVRLSFLGKFITIRGKGSAAKIFKQKRSTHTHTHKDMSQSLVSFSLSHDTHVLTDFLSQSWRSSTSSLYSCVGPDTQKPLPLIPLSGTGDRKFARRTRHAHTHVHDGWTDGPFVDTPFACLFHYMQHRVKKESSSSCPSVGACDVIRLRTPLSHLNPPPAAYKTGDQGLEHEMPVVMNRPLI